MPRREDDEVASRPGVPSTRALTQAGSFLLVAAATLVVLLTDNPQLLKVAVVAVAWAFLIASFAAGRRGTDRLTAAVRERELRRNYELELEREVAARHEYELELENELRRETEDAMRYELEALRGEMAALSGLRDEVARVSALREDIAGLTALRDEVARVAALRDDVVALNSLRQELGQLAELRADMGRLRAELTEQLSSEMLVERIVMRTQAGRLTAEGSRLDAATTWTDDVPPRELTGGWPAVRLDEPRETQQFEQVRLERAAPRPPASTAEPAGGRRTHPWESAPADPRPWDAPLASTWEDRGTSSWTAAPSPPPPAAPAYTPPTYSPPPAAPKQDRWSALTDQAFAESPRWSAGEPSGSPRSRHSVAEPATQAAAPMTPAAGGRPVPYRREAPPTALTPIPAPPVTPVEPPPSPMEWLAARALLDQPPAASRAEVPMALRPKVPPRAALRPEAPPLRRGTDDLAHGAPEPPVAATAQRPVAPGGPPPVRVDDRGGYRVAVRDSEPPPSPSEPTTQGTRVAEILAENGVTPPSGGRRRRRYRDDDETDDVLARVLRQN
jgi:hypothetical protein